MFRVKKISEIKFVRDRLSNNPEEIKLPLFGVKAELESKTKNY